MSIKKRSFVLALLFIFSLFFVVKLPVEAATTSSGLPWISGSHVANELQPHLNFGTWRGRPIDAINVFTSRGSWGGITNPTNIFEELGYKNYKGMFIISQPMYPQGQGNNATCATGAYDNYWKDFGTFLKKYDRDTPNTIIRIGWEFNGTFMYWHTDADPTNFKNCWRQVAKAIKSTAPNVLIDWTVNGHGGPVPAGGNMYTAYPGDDVVDIIGTDSYDHYPPSRNQAEWDNQCNAGGGSGLCDIIKFARQHGKKYAVGEWGIAVGSDQGGGDNPFYVEKMFETFKNTSDILAYEAYYNAPLSIEPNNVGSGIASPLGSVDAPNASKKYLALFGKDSPVGIPVDQLPQAAQTASDTQLQITLSLHGIGAGGDNTNPTAKGNFSPKRSKKTFTADIYNNQNVLVKSKSFEAVFSSTTGKFTGEVNIGEIPAGNYLIQIKGAQYLKKQVSGIQSLQKGINILPEVSLVTGDITNDNKLNIEDYNVILSCYADLETSETCISANQQTADITDDGNVNHFDYNLFLREIANRSGL
ncbi:MAG: glycosyl hydrolase [Patescibacteria group bacterium]